MAKRNGLLIAALICLSFLLTTSFAIDVRAQDTSGVDQDQPGTASQQIFLPLIETDDASLAIGPSFTVDPENAAVQLTDAITEEVTTVDSTALASTKPRSLLFGKEIALASYQARLLKAGQTVNGVTCDVKPQYGCFILWASFRNITPNKRLKQSEWFLQPFSFTKQAKNIQSSIEPKVTDADLGGDGVLSPGEATAIFVFKVVHKKQPFIYLLNVNAVVSLTAPTNTPPTVTITAPADGATFTAPATIPINATAADSDGTISKVEFFQNNNKLGEVTTAPYNFTWNNVATGAYTLTVKATDNKGATTTSAPVHMTVRAATGNQPPVTNITSPVEGALFTAPASIVITATATDPDGSISKVEFFVGNTKLGEATSSPYRFSWNNVAVGAYVLTVKATDNQGAASFSIPIHILVNQPPAVNIITPAGNATFTTPVTITINANATDSDGLISKVEFFANANKLGEATSAPYTFNWSNVATGSYTLTVKATDDKGAITTSSPVHIAVNPRGNTPPTVSITSPTEGAQFTAPVTITINANATDSDGTVSKVEFFVGTNKLGEVTSGPYRLNWPNVATGSYTLTVKATDDQGAATTSAPVHIVVNSPANVPPVVTLLAPTDGATFTMPVTITLQAAATDPDGTISKVEFFAGVNKLGEATANQYTLIWPNVATGTYTLTVKATDNKAATTTSAAVHVRVNPPANLPPVVSIITPTNGAQFTVPVTITINAAATDSDGSISKVEFFEGTNKLGEATTSPYTINWPNVATGSYTLTVKATDDKGAMTTSAAVHIGVNPPANQLPVVNLTNPSDGAQFTTPVTLTLTANATDSDGTISKVTFFENNQKLSESSTSPYSFAWSNVPTGVHTLTVSATDNIGATTVSSAVHVTVSPPAGVPPVVSLNANPTAGALPLLVNFNATVTGAPGDALTYTWSFGNGESANGSETVPDSGVLLVTKAYTYTTEGAFAATFTAKNSFGQTSSGQVAITAEKLTTIVRTTPTNGEGEVSVTRETIIEFSDPVNASTITPATINAQTDGQTLTNRLQLSPDRKRVTLFYAHPLPASARITLTINGDQLTDDRDKRVDADGNGQAGGVATIAFTTLSLTRIPGTDVWGYVYDSYNKNPDGTNKPVVGATIRIDGFPEANAVTDQNGHFILKDMPAPQFFVHIDGSTATNAPPNTVYATVGKAFHSMAGQSTQLVMDSATFNIYLPPMDKGDIQSLSPTQNTNIGFGAAGKAELAKLFPNMNPALWDRVKVTFPPNSAQDDAGHPATQAAIIPVPPDRIPAPLPTYIKSPLVISVQAVGANNFATPAPVCFPNLPDPNSGQPLAPWAKSALISFNHDAGRWEVVGPMTVSMDGLLVCTDPGVGVRAPGWHVVQPSVTGKCGSISNSASIPPSVGVRIVDPAASSVNLHTGATGYFQAVGYPSGGTYHWNSQSLPQGNANADIYTVLLGNTPTKGIVEVTYSYTYSYTDSCGQQQQKLITSAPAQVVVDITDNGCKVAIKPSGSINVQTGKIEPFLADGTPSGGIFKWNGGKASGPIDQRDYFASFTSKSTVDVIYTCLDQQGKPTGTATDSVNVDIAPTSCSAAIDGKNPRTVPAKTDETFTATVNPTNGTYAWSGGDNPQNPTIDSFTTSFNDSKTYLVSLSYTCKDPQGNTTATVLDSVAVDVDITQKTVTGLQGDIIEVNLPSLFGPDYSNFKVPFNIPKPCGEARDIDNQFSSTSTFYFVPTVDPARPFCTDTLVISADKAGSSPNLTVEFRILDGFSRKNQPGEVKPGTNPLDIYRLQQRLKYFGFKFGQNGEELIVNGNLDDTTKWVIGLFSHAVNNDVSSKRNDYTNSTFSLDKLSNEAENLINDTTTPRWLDLSASLANSGYTRSTANYYGTNWAKDILIYAVPQPGGFITAISRKQGGLYAPHHTDHIAGMDIDYAPPKPGTEIQANGTWATPFYKTIPRPSGEYIAAKAPLLNDPDGNNHIIFRGPSGYYAGSIAAVNSPPSGSIPLRHSAAICNKQLLKDISSLLVDNPKVSSLNEVRQRLQTFLQFMNRAAPSGAWVSSVYYDDPRTRDINGVEFVDGHCGHIHIKIEPPSQLGQILPVQPALQTGLHYYALMDLNTGQIVQRGTAGSNGIAHDNLILAPNTNYADLILQANSLKVGDVTFTTPDSGQTFVIPNIIIHPFDWGDNEGEALPDNVINDADSDGLPDDGELIIGTDPNNPDSDGDGIPDGVEVQQGSNPLDGKTARTGIIATVDTPGNAVDLCTLNNVAAVADSDQGVALVNLLSRENPMLITQVATPGSAQRIACTGVISQSLAVVANDNAGLAVIDFTTPTAARIIHQISTTALGGKAQAVVASAGLAYVGLDSGALVVVDLTSGTVLERVTIGQPLVDLAIGGDTLYGLSVDKLYTLPLNQANLSVAGTVKTPTANPNQRLFVGGGIAYITQPQGYNTFSLTNPLQPTLISAGATSQRGWWQLIVNGSGLGLGAVGLNPGDPRDLYIHNVSDPTQTNRFVTSFDMPGSAEAIAIANGLAYVADGSAGLHVVNYLAYDVGRTPPTITLSTNVPGGTVEEGQPIRATAIVSDDVQVRSVDFYVNGVKVATDGSFPFEYRFIAPRRSQQVSFTVRAVAWDTGGNSTTTADQAITLATDNTAPQLTRVSPSNGATAGNVGALAAFFSEPLDPASLTQSSFKLTEAGPDGQFNTADDRPIITGTLEFRTGVLAAFMTFPSGLSNGFYRAEVTGALTDLTHHALANPQSWSFHVVTVANDSDNDCLPNSVEIALGLNPNNADSDGDGVLDGDEDFDNDSLTNCNEVIIGTDLAKIDTDGDGIPDGAEDADNDGLTNIQETATCHTNPVNFDTDGDGVYDGLEVGVGSNPLDPSSTPESLTKLPGEAAGPTFSIVNLNDPTAPNLPGEADGPVFSVQNTTTP